jgi:hypothetical protein
VTKYIHTVDRLPPQAEGQFTFIRKMKWVRSWEWGVGSGGVR